MKLRRAEVQNFGSYRNLNFSFRDCGLALIFGPTGAGKSTLMDIPCWILYGITSKDGNADEVRSWLSPDPTHGEIEVETLTGIINVFRTRGKTSHNDLYWLESDADTEYRGKDLAETQKLLEERLGVSAELYVTSCYFSEFSPTAHFFSAKAKDRRTVFENLANLNFPNNLNERLTNEKKDVKKHLTEENNTYRTTTGRLDQLKSSYSENLAQVDLWAAAQKQKIKQKEIEFKNSKETPKVDPRPLKEKLTSLKTQYADLPDSRCGECGAPKNNTDRERLTKEIATLSKELALINAYAKFSKDTHLDDIQQLKAEVNPFINVLDKQKKALDTLYTQHEALKNTVQELEHKMLSLEQLQTHTQELKSLLLNRVVSEIEVETNRILEVFFESELRVGFELAGSDNLTVGITKNGYDAVFRQLSRGQRQILKLSFAVAVQKSAANAYGHHFSNLFFDESLDGLDETLKLKSFRLFQELATEHESVMVIEHSSEFKELFSRTFEVTVDEDASVIRG